MRTSPVDGPFAIGGGAKGGGNAGNGEAIGVGVVEAGRVVRGHQGVPGGVWATHGEGGSDSAG